jgi:hypothetical protein
LRSIDQQLAPGAHFRLGEVKEFTSLVAQAQEQGVPLSEVSGAPAYQKEQARQAFDEIATKIVARLDGN